MRLDLKRYLELDQHAADYEFDVLEYSEFAMYVCKGVYFYCEESSELPEYDFDF